MEVGNRLRNAILCPKIGQPAGMVLVSSIQYVGNVDINGTNGFPGFANNFCSHAHIKNGIGTRGQFSIIGAVNVLLTCTGQDADFKISFL